MPNSAKPEMPVLLDRVVVLFLSALFLLVSPLMQWWAGDGSPWYLPFLLWGGLILLARWLQRCQERHDL